MPERTVAAALREDRWSLAQGDREAGPLLIRFRTPVLGPDGVDGYGRVLRILWAYAEEGSGELPAEPAVAAMERFEHRFCAAVEADGCAFLAAVLTFDGARQWVFYTGDVAECGRRLEAMPQESEPYPIDLDAFDDPAWDYLRDSILGTVGPKA